MLSDGDVGADATTTPKRALILAGGGLKVAFQAGVLQVWLDEARDEDGQPLDFFYGDGASGGCFNLAMWCQGLRGHDIAQRWRETQPLRGLTLGIQRLTWVPTSLLGYAGFRKNVLQDGWKLRWDLIRGTKKKASFNLYNVSRQELVVRQPHEMDENALISAVSLPMWFPPVTLNDPRHPAAKDAYIDAVYATDANLEAAIAAGADELWVVWTVSQRGRWRSGFVNEFFQIIESAANSRVRAVLDRIERNNDLQESGGTGEFGRVITVRWLSAEVPAHYLLNYTQATMREAVDRGVTEGRKWCAAHDFEVRPSDPPTSGGRVSFRERLTGDFQLRDDPRPAQRWVAQSLSLNLRIEIPDVDYFVAAPRHSAGVTGTVECEALGGRRPLVDGVLSVLSDQGDPAYKSLVYRLAFLDAHAQPVTLIGRKYVEHAAGRLDLWTDTTTLFVQLYRGRWFDPLDTAGTASTADGAADQSWIEAEPPPESLLGEGIVRLSPEELLRELASFSGGRSSGRSGGWSGSGTQALVTFGEFFLRQLAQVYASGAQPRTMPQYEPPTSRRRRRSDEQ